MHKLLWTAHKQRRIASYRIVPVAKIYRDLNTVRIQKRIVLAIGFNQTKALALVAKLGFDIKVLTQTRYITIYITGSTVVHS